MPSALNRHRADCRALQTTRHAWFSVVAVTLLLGYAIEASVSAGSAQDPVTTVNDLIGWLDAPETAWVATARLQAVGHAALPLLLQPGRLV